jgi:hypothetical protein
MAKIAGLELRERWSDWDRTPVPVAGLATHLSVGALAARLRGLMLSLRGR